MNILLLEDDVILQEIIEEFLVEKGYEVESFFDGEKALDAIGSSSYDMLLLDVSLESSKKVSKSEILPTKSFSSKT